MNTTKHIKIVGVPKDGPSAPQWVREQWVGMVLPIVKGAPFPVYGIGAVGGLPENKRYVVKTAIAVSQLKERNSEAACQWWRSRFVFDGPHSLEYLVFPREICEPLD